MRQKAAFPTFHKQSSQSYGDEDAPLDQVRNEDIVIFYRRRTEVTADGDLILISTTIKRAARRNTRSDSMKSFKTAMVLRDMAQKFLDRYIEKLPE